MRADRMIDPMLFGHLFHQIDVRIQAGVAALAEPFHACLPVRLRQDRRVIPDKVFKEILLTTICAVPSLALRVSASSKSFCGSSRRKRASSFLVKFLVDEDTLDSQCIREMFRVLLVDAVHKFLEACLNWPDCHR